MPLKYEDEVIAAVKKLAHSVNSDGKAADLSSLIDITSRLPLTNLESWESLLRWQFIRTEECSSSSFRWKFWSKPQPRPKPAPPLTWIDICNRDGFKREKALRSLSGAAPNSFFFALVTRRLNDWVPQVRCAARESLPAIAQASDPEHVVDVLCIILPHWNSWGRMEDADKQVILDTISLKKVAHALKLRIISTASGPMTSILAQTGRTAVLDSHLDEIAQKAIQPAVRAKAYRCQLEGKMVWFAGKKWQWTNKPYGKGRLQPILCERALSATKPFEEILQLAARDRSPIVRRVAGEMLIRELQRVGSEAKNLATMLASDSSPSVAERGRFVLKRLGSAM
ncbi:MAG: hypothetical protein SD837_02385 [Candidatus Electrothrix scaldis]|nr:MAG: hypothetical protein SD837_02385 [Candidatus Electrothrix sp. GW3-3]